MPTQQRQQKMFAIHATVLLGFLSLSQSTSRSCEDLLRPLDLNGSGQLWGTWALVAGSHDQPSSLEDFRTLESITMSFTPSAQNDTSTPNNDTASYTQIIRFMDLCEYLPYNISIATRGAFTFLTGGRFNLTGDFLGVASCPDCVVMRWNVVSSRRVSLDVYLLSRRREVGVEVMEEYEAQLRCLGLPAPVVIDPEKEL